jgi:hypothetical protein
VCLCDHARPVAGDVELGAAVAHQLATDERVVALEQPTPGAIPELGRPRRGVDAPSDSP